ncbi:hypothetical protein AYI70_g11763 [Smittium culicis]|uniref:DDE Tnp4 domain-containing protein n=1 Tax=Smittium culicis TaxID=133412 RepID=A0A1R1X0F6_9FUNG|nr:hypothetical protein AYI70_g11763 [Smittium culicis]
MQNHFDIELIFYSGKHHRYCIKREVAVIPDGRCAFVSIIHEGSVHDMTVSSTIYRTYKEFLKKTQSDYKFPDSEDFDEWSIMADKRYVGLNKKFRVVVPNKRNQRTTLENRAQIQSESPYVQSISSSQSQPNLESNFHNGRIIVEDFFWEAKK